MCEDVVCVVLEKGECRALLTSGNCVELIHTKALTPQPLTLNPQPSTLNPRP